MSRMARVFRASGATVAMIGLTMVAVSEPAGADAASRYVPMMGSVAPFASQARALGDVSATEQLTIQLWLRPDMSSATSFAGAVSAPANPLYRQYLSPAAYSAKFGASKTAAKAVATWLRSEGFVDVHADAQRAYIRATAPVGRIDSAFKVQMKLYTSSKEVNAGPHSLRSNDRPVSLPASLAQSVLGITGLDNAAPASTLDRIPHGPATVGPSPAASAVSTDACSHYYGQHETGGLPEQFGTTTFPTEVCGYSASQIRAAYGANDVNTGKGETVALVELGLAPDMFKTLKDYSSANGMPAPSPSRYAELSLGRGSACGDPFVVEEQLDVEASYDAAPGANQLVVGGDSCSADFGLQGLFNADEAVLGGTGNAPFASIVSNSWESGPESQPASWTNVEHSFLVRAAAEGVGMYFSAGDISGVEAPSSDPFAIAVGGTTLGIGSSGKRLFETGWSTALSFPARNGWFSAGEQGASGGGPSLLWREPSYQKGVVPPALTKTAGNRGAVRSVPDIGADADPFTGFAVGLFTTTRSGVSYGELDVGGTSLAAPLVAGMVAAAQQGQTEPFGFLNPLLYSLVGTNAVNDVPPLVDANPASYRGVTCDPKTCGTRLLSTFDDQSPSMIGYTGQVALKGYDNMSGIGTPNGQKFIVALRTTTG